MYNQKYLYRSLSCTFSPKKVANESKAGLSTGSEVFQDTSPSQMESFGEAQMANASTQHSNMPMDVDMDMDMDMDLDMDSDMDWDMDLDMDIDVVVPLQSRDRTEPTFAWS
ncbi:GM22505 [Drosophila sechellia]|uniref:GM22505 n=1 Tax=Drosophila sechellia TaxID=7238 RepID=B4IKG9_DROSE|nr:GM22505 [Drosophila sechellia]